MWKKLVYGYAAVTAFFLARAEIRSFGHTSNVVGWLLNAVILVALLVFLYRRSPRLRERVAQYRKTIAARRALRTGPVGDVPVGDVPVW